MIPILRSLERVRGHTISILGLGAESIVVDAGAHRGEFSRLLSERFGCRCLLVEANPELADILRRETSADVVVAALAGEDGTAQFRFRENIEGGSVFPRTGDRDIRATTVETMTLETLLERSRLQAVDVLKLDIEGAEFAVLQSAAAQTLAGIGQITVEFHDFLPEFSDRGLFEHARRRLDEIGFACCPISFRTHGDVLFLNRRNFDLRRLSASCVAASAGYLIKMREALAA
jgi:FkbM family methyltransferase